MLPMYSTSHVSAGGLVAERSYRHIFARGYDADEKPAVRKESARARTMLIGGPASTALQHDLDRLAAGDVTVLVLGETGTGKELAARYLHANSHRRSGPFVAVNCGALTNGLAEAELFGHEKGAFTGAVRDQQGWFEAAQGGTILLDEVGDLPLNLQVKLLRVLQEQEVTRVGSRRSIPIDVRVVAATNVDLKSAVKDKLFREDLFFRLNVASIQLPPLRERVADIVPLARHFLDLYKVRLGREALDFGSGVPEALERYPWPGNIRELENVIQNATHMARGDVVLAADLGIGGPAAALDTEKTLEKRIEVAVAEAVAAGEGEIFRRAVSSVVLSAFDVSGSNQVRTASALGTTRNSLRTQLARLGIVEPRRRGSEDAQAKTTSTPMAPLNIGYQKYGTSSVLKCKGTLERRLAEGGIAVTWTEFSAGPQLLEALDRGTIDFGTTGEAPPVFAQAAGVPLVYLAYDPPAPEAEAIVVHGDSKIHSMVDLKDKRVGLNPGSNVHYLLLRALHRAGLSDRDISQVDLSPSMEPLRLLERGEIDAWVIWDPLLSAALHTANLRVIADGNGLVANRQFYLGRRSFVRDNPQTIETLLRELQIAGQQAVQHSASIAKRLAEELNIDAVALEAALRRMTYGMKPLDADVIAEQQIIADTLYMTGLLPSSVLVSDAVYPI